MTGTAAAVLALVVLLAATAGIGATIVTGRAARRSRQRRDERLAAPARQVLLAIAAGDDDPDGIEALVALPPAPWRAVEPTAIALLGTLRGDSHAKLVSVFDRRDAAAGAMRDLRRRDPVRRARAADVLGHLPRTDSIPALTALLDDRSADVRAAAVRALGRIGDPSAAQPLLACLARHRPVAEQLVAQALVRLGVDALPDLLTALRHRDEAVRATAVQVLGLIGAVDAADDVADTLRCDESLEVRIRAARTLGRLGARHSLAPLLHAVEPAESTALRSEAARALGDLGAVAAATPLAVLLADPAYPVAHEAARSLLQLGPIGHAILHGAIDDPESPSATAHAREALGVAASEDKRIQLTAGLPRREPTALVAVPTRG
ncbi:MAG TPA: HEAT repeat domain-containing protein [Micromonosporaceae bacterium]|nr:HEAT repeat domain-containing protein [Micromonosporaceae bacterium]